MEYCRLLVLVAVVCVYGPLGIYGWATECRCVPDQWEGILSSTDRDFDLYGGRTMSTDDKLFVSYDYKNKLFSITDVDSGNRAIADYAKGYKYIVRSTDCRAIRITGDMRQMCIPDNAELLGEHIVSNKLGVEQWQFVGPQNVTVRTLVLQSTCIPLTEEVYTVEDVAASLTTSNYFDVTLGIRDESIFDHPRDCMMDPRFLMPHYREAEAKRARKRSQHHIQELRDTLLNMAG